MNFEYANKGLVVVIAIVLFVIIHYIVKSSDDVNLINSIMEHSKTSCREEDYIYNLEDYKATYLKSRFKTYTLRGLIFGALFGGAIYLLKDEKTIKQNIVPVIVSSNNTPQTLPENNAFLNLNPDF